MTNCSCADSEALRASLAERLAANRAWVSSKGPGYFTKLQGIQNVEVLWIGCADARLPANELIGLKPGEVFVQRNVGNLATHKDMNVMACIEYAVNVLKVKHIIVCGHYGCNAVHSALTQPCKTEGLVNLWIQDIRDTRDRNVEALRALPEEAAQCDRLVELNVLRQVFNVCTSPIVQQAWDAGHVLAVHGLVYGLDDGELKALYTTDHAPTSKPGGGSFVKRVVSSTNLLRNSCSPTGVAAPAPGDSWASSAGGSGSDSPASEQDSAAPEEREPAAAAVAVAAAH